MLAETQIFFLGLTWLQTPKTGWAISWQTNKMACAPSEDSDQPGHPPSWSETSGCPHEESLGSQLPVDWLCWGLTSQSTIFQSCRDGAIASWVINQYFRGVKCLAQGHNTAAVGLEPRTSRSGVRHSTTEPPRSPCYPLSSEDSDQTGQMPRLIWVCWAHSHFVSFVVRRLRFTIDVAHLLKDV